MNEIDNKTTISLRFNGLFAPHWRTDARGTMVGITQYTTKGHICRATLEVRFIISKHFLMIYISNNEKIIFGKAASKEN